MTQRILSVPLTLTALAFMAACSHEQTKPAETAVVTTGSATPPNSSPNLSLSDRLKVACQIQEVQSVGEAPKFDFDQSELTATDRDTLSQIAQCMTVGPLKGRSVKLVGRADPRGTEEYNMVLGAHRSDAVLRYLKGLGVASSQLKETSRGALDATGSDETAWAADRRVDLDVVAAKQ